MLNALRLKRGFNINLFESRTGLEIDYINPILKKAISQKLLTIKKNTIYTTTLGYKFLNDITLLFIT